MKHVESHEQANGSFELIDLWDGADEVILVDAARSGAAAGTLHRFDATDRSLPQGVLATSTHSIGIPDTVELARTLGRLPERLVVYGIEVGDLTPGAPLSSEVEETVNRLVGELDHA